MDPAIRALTALRNRISARSGNTLARSISYKDMLKLADEAIADLEKEEA